MPVRLSVRLLDDKGELAKAPSDAVKAEREGRALTVDERRALRDKWEALLAVFGRKCETAQGDELDHYLRSALIMCAARPLPSWLFALLLKRLGRRATVDEIRWDEVRRAHDEEGLHWIEMSVGDDPDSPPPLGAYERASERLAGKDGAGGVSSMKRSYAKIEAELRRRGLGRPRTYRRRPRREG
jgi:hypothetical protein